MGRIALAKLVVVAAGAVLVAAESLIERRWRRPLPIALAGLTAWAAVNIATLFALCINHVSFPLNLDLMESVVLQHAERAASFAPIYPEPSQDFVPLAYNALYYVAAIPFIKVFGVQLFGLRVLSILGMVGSGALVYAAVWRQTRSKWWGFIAMGMFTAAYRVMDAYLDTAHSDSWLLCCALLGTYVIGLARTRAWNMAGIALLIAAFWFKQHGALFVLGALFYLTMREGLKRAWPYWFLAALAGPGLYIVAGPWLFGSDFHFFTWEAPRNWSASNGETVLRFVTFIAVSYPILALAGGVECAARAWRAPKSIDIWRWQGLFAVLTGIMGALDPGSSDNVFIPMGTWLIIVGTFGLYELTKRTDAKKFTPVCSMALFAVFAALVYNPAKLVVSPHAEAAYSDMIAMLRSLNAPVYAPDIGQLALGFVFKPAVHWVAVDDMLRGPGRDTRNRPETRRLLDSVVHPEHGAYILSNKELTDIVPAFSFLSEYYALETDFGSRFIALRTLPKRWEHGWPRYLYRYSPKMN